MADEIISRDQNRVTVLAGVTDDANLDIRMLRVDPTTKRLLVSATVSTSSVLTVGTTTIANGTTTRILYDNAGVLGEYTISGSGTIVAMATSPTFATSITGSYLTASELLITDADKKIVSAPVATYPSLTELTYLKGVTSAIQTQIGTKAPTTSPTFATSITGSYLTASELLITDADKKIVSAPVATYPSLTELSYVKGLSSAVQTQITAKAPSASPTFTGTITLADNARVDLTLPTADTYCTGNTTDSFASGYSSAVGDLVFFGSGGKWLEVDADAVATCNGLLGIALEAKTDTQAMKVALPGSFVRLDSWNWTVGATLYAGETLGAMQEAIPTGADAVIKVVGFAVSADVIYFNPSPDQQTTVA